MDEERESYIYTGCSRCGVFQKAMIISGKDRYCDLCWFKRTPPTLVLGKKRAYYALENMKTREPEYTTIAMLKDCGFHLFSVKYSLYKETTFIETYHLMFKGNVICRKIGKYMSWPKTFEKCNKRLCV